MYKKVKLLLLSIIFLVPFMVFAESKVENTNHSGDVYIASSELIKASDGVEEIEKPTLKDLNVKFNIRFSEVNQSIEYKLIIKNTSSKDYNISTDNSFNKSNYITYNFKYDDGSDIIKANSEEEMLVIITYTKEVPDNKLTDGKFIEDNAMSLNLSDEITNPSTILQRYGVNILLIIITCVSHVEIETEGEFCYKTNINEGIANETTPSESYTEVKALYKYRKGMTWEDYLNSDYNKITDSTTITYNNKQLNLKEYFTKYNKARQYIEEFNPIYIFEDKHNYDYTVYAFNHSLPSVLVYNNGEYKYFGENIFNLKIEDSNNGCYIVNSCGYGGLC